MFFGIGGAPEGVLAAVAIRSQGGEMQAKLLPENEEEIKRCKDMGITNLERVLTHEDLVSTDDSVFVATGITDNLIIDGIETQYNNYVTHSILISGRERQVRYVKSKYPIKDLKENTETFQYNARKQLKIIH